MGNPLRTRSRLLCSAVAVTAVFVLAAALVPDRGDGRAQPRPLDDEPGERDGPDESDPHQSDPHQSDPHQSETFRRRRAAWIESLHRHAPGVDWRATDAAYRAQRAARQQPLVRDKLAHGATRADLKRVELAALSGRWIERGSSNVAGRVNGIVYDAATNRITLAAAGGQLWRAERARLDWQSTSDTVDYESGSFMGPLLERVAGPAGERLLVLAERPAGLFHSDDGGATWTAASAPVFADGGAVRGIAVRTGTEEIHFVRVHSGAAGPEAHLLVSTDRGATVRRAGVVGGGERPVAIFAPRYDSTDVFLLVDDRVKRIVGGTTPTLVDVGVVPLDADTRNEANQATLAGGVANGRVFLYAFYPRPQGVTTVFRSLDGGVTWERRADAPTVTFTQESAGTSTRDPDRAWLGGLNPYRTTDGGATWTLVNDWTEYYVAPATKLHGDITAFDAWRDADGTERLFIGTDGGIYESTNGLDSVANLSLTGLRQSQYYSTYTRRRPPYSVYAGSQDQGYQKQTAATGALETFDQAISGDYGHLDSGDGGATVWMTYPGFVLLDTQAASRRSTLVEWSYGGNGFADWLFIAPLAVDATNPRRAFLAGGRTSGTGHHIVRLDYDGAQITGTQEPHEFAAPVTALRTTPGGTRYAMTQGRFWRDDGTGWIETAADLADAHYFYGNAILAHPQLADTVYVAGAGYSNPAVFRSDDRGNTFVPLATGLPQTLVFDLAMSADGAHLFAASEVGAFYYDAARARWDDLSGLGAPNQTYWSVEFSDAERRARFATYGRGIWDFALDDGPPTLNQHGLTGLWFEPATAGQGFALEFLPDLEGAGRGLVAGGWFTFDVADGQRWYAVSGPALVDATSTSLTIFRNTGGNFAAPPITAAQPFGTATFAVSSCARGTFDFSLDDGRTGSIALERLTPPVGCGAAATPDDAADFAFSGNWFDPATSGQGFVFEANPKLPLFVFAWYTYAPDGAGAGAAGQRWFTGQASYTRGARTLSMPIFETRGGRFDAPAPAPVTTRVGNATVALTSCTTARLDYAFDAGENAGRAGTIPLQRAGPAPAGCRP